MRLLLTAVALVLLSSAASATTIVVHVVGFVVNPGIGSSLSQHFAVADRLDLFYSYDSEAAAAYTFPNVAGYPLLSFYGTLGSYAFAAEGGTIELRNDPASPFGDQIFVRGDVQGASLGEADLVLGSLFFRDFDGVFLTSAELITRAPDLRAMEQFGFALGFDHPQEGRILVGALIVEVAVVSEPSRALLVVLVAAAVVRRRLAR